MRLWRPWRKETLSLGHSSFSFISSITIHSEGVNYACCTMPFSIIGAASFAQRRRSGDLGHSDLSPQRYARSGNKSAFCAVVVAIVSRLMTGLPKWAMRAPASTFRRHVCKPKARCLGSQFRSCTNDHRRREKMTFCSAQIIL